MVQDMFDPEFYVGVYETAGPSPESKVRAMACALHPGHYRHLGLLSGWSAFKYHSQTRPEGIWLLVNRLCARISLANPHSESNIPLQLQLVRMLGDIPHPQRGVGSCFHGNSN